VVSRIPCDRRAKDHPCRRLDEFVAWLKAKHGPGKLGHEGAGAYRPSGGCFTKATGKQFRLSLIAAASARPCKTRSVARFDFMIDRQRIPRKGVQANQGLCVTAKTSLPAAARHPTSTKPDCTGLRAEIGSTVSC